MTDGMNMKNKKILSTNLALFGLVVFFTAGCTKQGGEVSPEKAVNAYVRQAFDVKGPEDRQRLMMLTEGSAAKDLKKMSDEQFKREFIDSKLKLIDIKTKDVRQEDGNAVSLIYEISYQENGEKGPVEHFHRKVAFLKKTEGTWKIESTKNLKTFIEIKDGSEISVSPSTKK